MRKVLIHLGWVALIWYDMYRGIQELAEQNYAFSSLFFVACLILILVLIFDIIDNR